MDGELGRNAQQFPWKQGKEKCGKKPRDFLKRESVGKVSTVQNPSASPCQNDSKSSSWLSPKMHRPSVLRLSMPNSRYKNGTKKRCALAFPAVPYRALQSDRCLVITT